MANPSYWHVFVATVIGLVIYYQGLRPGLCRLCRRVRSWRLRRSNRRYQEGCIRGFAWAHFAHHYQNQSLLDIEMVATDARLERSMYCSGFNQGCIEYLSFIKGEFHD